MSEATTGSSYDPQTQVMKSNKKLNPKKDDDSGGFCCCFGSSSKKDTVSKGKVTLDPKQEAFLSGDD
jgi:hypothetical protein